MGFWPGGKVKAAIYTRVSTIDQQTLPMQMRTLKEYVKKRAWTLTKQVKEIASATTSRPKRDALMLSARRRQIDVIIVWKLDRWGRSLNDLVLTLKELSQLGVGFISVTEALDLTTPVGRAMAGVLAVFAEFERDILAERIRAGIAQARLQGKPHGRPKSAVLKQKQVKRLFAKGLSKSEIARRLGIGRTSVRRILSR